MSYNYVYENTIELKSILTVCFGFMFVAPNRVLDESHIFLH